VEVLVPIAKSVPQVAGPWRFRRERPHARSPRTVGGPPRFTVEETVLDLVAVSSDARRTAGLVTAAVQSRRTNPDRLRAALEQRHFMAGRALLRTLLADVAAGAFSPLELDYLRAVERPHGLPVGVRQSSQRGTEPDVWYEEYGLLVELDGRAGHEGTGRFRDMRRDNLATTAGLGTLRYGSYDVDGRPCEVAWQVGENLTRRGWPGPFVFCACCLRAA